MKRVHFTLLIFATVVLFACRGGETKADPETKDKEVNTEERIKDNPPSAAAASVPDSLGSTTPSNEILARIDQHLVSTPVFTAQATGDIVNVSVTIKNTLKDITFQKAIVEVTVAGADGKALKTDYFTIQNIEPGDLETIKLPNSKGISIVSHIVKVKSNQLTHGEMVLTGTHFDAGK